MTNSQYSILNGPDPAHSIAETVWGGASLTKRRSGVRAGETLGLGARLRIPEGCHKAAHAGTYGSGTRSPGA